MRLPRVNGLNAAASIFLSALLLAVGSSGGVVSALQHNGQSNVQVSLCSQPGEAVLIITAPPGRKVIEGNQVITKGIVSNLIEAAFYVDDAPQTTLTLGETAVGFEQPLTLQTGTRTIKVVGRDACGQDVATESVIVFMVPPEGPIAPGGSPKQAGTAKPTAFATPVPVVYYDTAPQLTSEPSAAADTSDKTQNTEDPLPDQATESEIPVIDKVTEWLNLGGTFASPGNVVRGMVAIIGIYAAVHAHALMMLAHQLLPRLKTPQQAKGRKGRVRQFKPNPRPRHKWLLRGVGVLLLIGLFIV